MTDTTLDLDQEIQKAKNLEIALANEIQTVREAEAAKAEVEAQAKAEADAQALAAAIPPAEPIIEAAASEVAAPAPYSVKPGFNYRLSGAAAALQARK